MLTTAQLDELRQSVRALDTGSGDPRIKEIVNRVLDAVFPVLHETRVTMAEWEALLAFLADTPLPMMRGMAWCLGLSQLVEENETNIKPPATANCVEGPFHVDGAPARASDGKLHEVDDGGQFLILQGRVLDTQDRPIPGVELDIWATNTEGKYSHFDPSQPKFNCRGKVRSDEQGRYRVFTPWPESYHMDVGEMGAVLKVMGHQIWRPKHVHFMIAHPGFEPLTTQVYFEGEPHNHDDPALGVKPSMVIPWQQHDDPAEIKAQGFDRPFKTATFDFRLQPVEAKIPALA